MNSDDLRDAIEERAAIVEEGEQVSRHQAEDIAARMHGFKNWADYLKTQPIKEN